MKDFTLNVKVDLSQVIVDFEKKTKLAQKKLDAQVLKDSNYYCPMDTGTLQKSGILNTVLGSGKVVWNTPYAKEQYYEKPNKSKQHNPNASQRWFERAKANKLKQWEDLVNAEYRKSD